MIVFLTVTECQILLLLGFAIGIAFTALLVAWGLRVSGYIRSAALGEIARHSEIVIFQNIDGSAVYIYPMLRALERLHRGSEQRAPKFIWVGHEE